MNTNTEDYGKTPLRQEGATTRELYEDWTLQPDQAEPLPKVKLSLIPSSFLMGIGKVLTHGMTKHSERGWEAGMDYDYLFSALQRHLWAWWGGEKIDPESGHSHLYHAACRLMMLATYEERDMGDKWDRRNQQGELFDDQEQGRNDRG